MIQLFLQVDDRAVYIASVSAISGNTFPTIKQQQQKKTQQQQKNKTLLQALGEPDGLRIV